MSEMMVYSGLLHHGICGMARFYYPIHCYMAFRFIVEPNVVVASAAALEIISVL
jgi:hypothetical protein